MGKLRFRPHKGDGVMRDVPFCANCRAAMSFVGAALLCLLLALSPAPARADYADGLRAFENGNYAEAISLWRVSAWQDDDLFSQIRLGQLYRDGEYVPRDPVEAYVWYFLASNNVSLVGITLASNQLALDEKQAAYSERSKLIIPMVPADRMDAEKRIVYILASRGADGFVRLGELYDATRDLPSDEAKLLPATGALTKAQDLLNILRNYIQGPFGPDQPVLPTRDTGFARNNAEALAYFIKSTERGHPAGIILQEHMRAVLSGSPSIIASAERRAADWEPPFEHYPGNLSDCSRGDSDRSAALDRVGELRLEFVQQALLALGYYLGPIDSAYGPGTREAIKKYQWSAGDKMTGLLTPEQTVNVIRAAAIKGSAVSQNTLGVMYYKGIGVPLDYVRARHWFERAGDQRYAEALYNLGLIYKEGRGVQTDKNQAATYFMAAQFAGYRSVAKELKELGWN